MQASLLGIVVVLAAQVGGANRYEAGGSSEPTPAGVAQSPVDSSDPSQAPDLASAISGDQNPQPALAVEFLPPEDPDSGRPRFEADALQTPPSIDSGPAARGASGGLEDPTNAPPETASPDLTPSQLTRMLLTAPTDASLSGISLSLVEALRDARERSEQTRIVAAYWALSAAVADYYLALREANDLSSLATSVGRPSPQWREAIVRQQARVVVAQRAAEAEQLQLHGLMGRDGGSMLPMPGDLPHCGRYDTRYEEIFADRRVIAAERLNELLPLRHDELRSQARGVAEAQDWLTLVSDRRNPETDGTGLLRAYELLALRRRAFISALRDYNEKIAAYTQIAAPGPVASRRLAAMMIRTSTDAEATSWTRPDIRPASTFEASMFDAEPAADNGAPSAGEDANLSDEGRRGPFRQLRRVRRPILDRLNARDREHSILLHRSRRRSD